MSQGELDFVGQEEQRPARSKGLIAWSVLLFVAFLIYEITARPTFGIVILCSKFGWDNFLTAHWLRRVDPNRSRGQACFWFFLAVGLLRVMYASLALYAALFYCMLLFIGPAAFVAQIAFRNEVIVAAGTFLVAGLLTVLATLLGLRSAFRVGLRIWLAYPPFMNRGIDRGKNWAEFFPVIVILFLFMPWTAVFCLVGTLVDPQPQGIKAVICVSLLTIWWIAFIFPSVKLFFALKRRFVAERPWECWQPDLIGEIMVSPMLNWKRWRRLAAIQQNPN